MSDSVKATSNLSFKSVDDGYMDILAEQLFNLPVKSSFTKFPSPADQRGYLELYGEDPETEYRLDDDENSPVYQALSCFLDHISFILNGTFDCVITPDKSGIKLLIINSDDDSIIRDQIIKSREDLLGAVRSVIDNQETAAP